MNTEPVFLFINLFKLSDTLNIINTVPIRYGFGGSDVVCGHIILMQKILLLFLLLIDNILFTCVLRMMMIVNTMPELEKETDDFGIKKIYQNHVWPDFTKPKF